MYYQLVKIRDNNFQYNQCIFFTNDNISKSNDKAKAMTKQNLLIWLIPFNQIYFSPYENVNGE